MNIARNQHALSDRWPVVTPVRLCPDGKVVLEIFVETRIGEEDLQELCIADNKMTAENE